MNDDQKATACAREIRGLLGTWVPPHMHFDGVAVTDAFTAIIARHYAPTAAFVEVLDSRPIVPTEKDKLVAAQILGYARCACDMGQPLDSDDMNEMGKLIAAHRQAAVERECARIALSMVRYLPAHTDGDPALAADPDYVLGLLTGTHAKQLTQARAEIAALQLDAERLDWLDDSCEIMVSTAKEGAELFGHNRYLDANVKPLRQALDQARSSSAGR